MKDKLKQLKACNEAIKWCGDRTPEEAYRDCERGDWLLWMAAKSGVDRRLIVLAACDCAATVSHLAGDEAREAIRVARLWADGKAGLEEGKDAADAIYTAATAAYAAAAATADAAAAAAYKAAAKATRAAATAAADAADAAATKATRAAAAAADATYTTTTIAAAAAVYAVDAAVYASHAIYAAEITQKHRELANIVRKRIPFESFK